MRRASHAAGAASRGCPGRVAVVGLVFLLGGASTPVMAGDGEEAPAVRVNRYLVAHEFDRAAGVCRDQVRDDRSDPALRASCAQTLVMRDRVCLPAPPDAEALHESAAGTRNCDASFLSRAAQDSIAGLLAVEVQLAPDDIQSYLLSVDHEIRFGTPDRLRLALAGMRRFEASDIHDELLVRLQTIQRPGMAAVAARAALESGPDPLGCDAALKIAGSLLQAGDFDRALAGLGRAPADSSCVRQRTAMAASILTVAGRHRELWELTRRAPSGIATIEYYRYVLLSSLAAAHFDSSLARNRLDYEEANQSSYPELAGTFLDDLRALLDEPAAPGEAWAELAERDLVAGVRFGEVRVLLRSLALRRNPRLGSVALDQANDLASRSQLRSAGEVLEDVAGGRQPELDRRWDPRRPEYLRQSAVYYFKADDDISCREVLDAIDEPNATDRLLAGAAALRAEDWAVAKSHLEQVKTPAADVGQVETANRLLALIPARAHDDASP